MSCQKQKSSFSFTFILASLAVQERLSFQYNHTLSSSECCCNVLWSSSQDQCSARQPQQPPNSFLEKWVGADYLDLALDMFLCPLSCFSDIVHAEDARSVVEATCACTAPPSCWREIFRCCFASSSLYQRSDGERKATWRDQCYIYTCWLPDLPAEWKTWVL